MGGSLMGTKNRGWMDQIVRIVITLLWKTTEHVFESSGHV